MASQGNLAAQAAEEGLGKETWQLSELESLHRRT